MKKKLMCATLAMAMVFSLAGCGSSTSTSAEPAKEETVEAETKAEDETEAEAEAEAPAETEAKTEAETPAETEAKTEAEAPAETEAKTEAEAPAETAAAETADATYTNKGYTLTIPAKYDDLLFTTTPEEEGVLFMCSEIASIEAAENQGMELDGVGLLFSIQTTDEATLNEMLCSDMSGIEPFATDGNGTYFLYVHPTDVRLVRDNYDDPDATAMWTELNEWAATIPDTFLKDNAQLTAAKYGNTELDVYLARIAFEKDTNYVLSTTEFLELEPKDVDPAPYLEKLRNNVTYEPVDEEAPDGEYVVLNFPDDHVRFDFFYSEEKVNYVRQVWGENDEWEQIYKANFEDSSINAAEVMQEWYDALAVANGKK